MIVENNDEQMQQSTKLLHCRRGDAKVTNKCNNQLTTYTAEEEEGMNNYANTINVSVFIGIRQEDKKCAVRTKWYQINCMMRRGDIMRVGVKQSDNTITHTNNQQTIICKLN